MRLGDIDVSCEGYYEPDDPNVLKGSCGLRYTLEYTPEGRVERNQHHYEQSSREYDSSSSSTAQESGGGIETFLVVTVGIVVLVGLIAACSSFVLFPLNKNHLPDKSCCSPFSV